MRHLEKDLKLFLLKKSPCISPYIYYSGIWGYVVISKYLHDLLIRDLGIRMIKKVDEAYLVDSNEFYTKILAKIYDLGGYVLTGFSIEPFSAYGFSRFSQAGSSRFPQTPSPPDQWSGYRESGVTN